MYQLLNSPYFWLVVLTIFIVFLLLVYVLMYRVMKCAVKEVTKDAIYEVVYEALDGALDGAIADVNWNTETVLTKSGLDLVALNRNITRNTKLNEAIYKMLDEYIYEDDDDE